MTALPIEQSIPHCVLHGVARVGLRCPIDGCEAGHSFLAEPGYTFAAEQFMRDYPTSPSVPHVWMIVQAVRNDDGT